MSDFHQAVYAKMKISRTIAARQIKSLFRKHNIRFTHNVRGLYWNSEWNEFTPNIDQEIEDIDRFDDAVSATLDWTCACFDLLFQQWDIELYLISSKESDSVILSFPNSVYKIASENHNIAASWLELLVDVGMVFGGLPMICGPDVPIIASSDERLMARFQQYLKNYKLGTYSVHTVLCNNDYKSKFETSFIEVPHFYVTTVAMGYHQITLLET